LILGIPTWDFGEIQEDWEAVWEQLDDLNLEGKNRCALRYGRPARLRRVVPGCAGVCCMTNLPSKAL
ncbi:flavodoxin FldB, partial [Salmonella enterica subsp. enterica serovar Enteritidis str. 13183-1]